MHSQRKVWALLRSLDCSRNHSRADLKFSEWLGIVYYFSYRGVYYRTIVFTMSFVNDTIIFTPPSNRSVPRSPPLVFKARQLVVYTDGVLCRVLYRVDACVGTILF